jgi:hypothetical protein
MEAHPELELRGRPVKLVIGSLLRRTADENFISQETELEATIGVPDRLEYDIAGAVRKVRIQGTDGLRFQDLLCGPFSLGLKPQIM